MATYADLLRELLTQRQKIVLRGLWTAAKTNLFHHPRGWNSAGCMVWMKMASAGCL